VVSDGTRTTLYVDGTAVANLPVALPSLNGPAFIGGDGDGKPGFAGEIDEMEVSKAARSPGFIKLRHWDRVSRTQNCWSPERMKPQRSAFSIAWASSVT
jgi:hypothetical protein